MVTFEVKSKTNEVFFENIKYVPTNIRGAFFVSMHSKEAIDFKILGPNHNIIFEKHGKSEGIYNAYI
jgi:hypothetical protein